MIALVIICIACAAYLLWKQYNIRSDEPPLLPGYYPVIGHALSFIGNSCKLWETLNEFAQHSYGLGGVVAARIGPQTLYAVTDPDDMFTVANTCLEKDGFYDFAKPWIGEGLITAKLSIWKKHRKLLNPAFSQMVLDQFMGVFNSQSRKLVDALDKEVGRGYFNHWMYTRSSALETICLTALGVDFTDTLLNNKYFDAVELLFNSQVERFTKFWLHSSYTFRFSLLKKKQDDALQIVHKVSDTFLQKRKTEFDGPTCAERSIIPGTRFKAFLDLLLELSLEKGLLNDKEVREHVDTMIVSGYETSANAIMYAMLLLGAYPKVQEKVLAELKEVLGEGDRDVEKQNLSKLVYLEAVIKESIRIYTIGPVIARKLDRNVKLKNYTLLAGRTCVFFLFGVHRHPIWGPGLPENPNAFAAFSLGRRLCIGKHYAMMSMKTTLAHIVRKYRITADHSQLLLKMEVMLKPVNGHLIQIERRT